MIRLRTLGQSDLVVGEDRDANALLSQPKRFALLCYLALPKPGVMVRRDALLGLFWPEDSEQPRVALRQALSHIRKVLGHDVIVGRGSQEVGLNPDLLWCDVAAFEQALDANDLTAAIQLYQGELLQGFYLSHDPEWEHWLDGERARLAHRYAVAMEGLAKSEVAAGNVEAAVEWWQALVRHDPYDSRYAMSLMESLEQAGDPGNALRRGQQHKEFLLENLEIVPSPEFEALVERMHAEHGPEGGPPEIERRHQWERRAQPAQYQPRPGLENTSGAGETSADATLTSTQTRPVRQWMVSGVTALVAVVLALFGAYLMIPRESVASLDPEHVVVGTFRNATGDPSLDLLGERAGHWITQGLQHASVPVTPWDVALQAWELVQEHADAGEIRNLVKALGEETGAGTVISGAIYLEGDALEFQVDVSDALRGRLLGSPPPIAGHRDAQRELIGEVQQQVMVFLAATFDERLVGLAPNLMSAAPSFEAYQAFLRGFERHTALDYEGAISDYKRALQLDPTWAQPAIRMKAAIAQGGTRAEHDSLMILLEGLWDKLSQYERAVVESFRARDNGEHKRLLVSLRQEVELAPGSPSVNNLAHELNSQNRPSEALTLILSVDFGRGWWRQWAPRWDIVSDAYHLLGEFEHELEAASRCRRLHPDYLRCREFRSRAVAAMGRTSELNGLMAEVERADSLPLLRDVMMPAIETLRANGYESASLQLAERATSWLDSRPEGHTNTLDHRSLYGKALFLAGRLDESRVTYDSLVQDFPKRVDLRAARAFVAGMNGDHALAVADNEWFALYDGSEWTEESILWFRGIVAGALGRLDEAVDLLSQADIGFEPADRIGMYYGPLRGYPPFQEWLRPKG